MFETQKDYLKYFHEIGIERNNQLAKEYTAAHDDEHDQGELVQAAAAFLGWAKWPWEENSMGKTPSVDHVRQVNELKRKDLIKAAAMIIAELQRIDRSMAEKLTQKELNYFLVDVIEAIQANVRSKTIKENLYEDLVSACDGSNIQLDSEILGGLRP